jgi:undecaprenyl-diphosphatase
MMRHPSGSMTRRALQRLGVRSLAAASLVLLAALILAALVVFARSKTGAVHRLDVSTANDLNRYLAGHRGQVHLWKAVTDIGGPSTWRVLAAVAVVVLWVRRQRRAAMFVAVAMIGAAVLSGVTKALIGRARPIVKVPVDRVGGGSFPSGHALTSFAAVGALLLLLLPVLSTAWRAVLVSAAVVVVAAVGFSRLILGVHYVTDVLGGWLIAGLWLAALWSVFRRGGRRRPA